MADPKKTPRILVIDDDRTIHIMLASLFAAHGFEVASAYSGEEGLKMVKDVKPDLILLDVVMPGIQGREVCSRIKDDPQTSAIPILFLTVKESETDFLEEFDAGGDGHVTKPIHAAPLISEIKKILGI